MIVVGICLLAVQIISRDRLEVWLRFAGQFCQSVHPISRSYTNGSSPKQCHAQIFCAAENQIYFDAFTVLANAKTFPYEGAKTLCPQFWQEHFASGKGKIVMGTYGINIDPAMGHDTFEYLIADPCKPEQTAPEGFAVWTIPAFTWAVFPCVGAMPNALQDVNTRIFSEWLPAIKDYEFAAGYCVEYYDDPSKYEKGTQDEKYYCEIWIPVKKK